MTRVLDYSAGFPGAKAIKAAGYAGAVRYIGSPGNTKCATKNELQDFDREGLGMALVFEQTAGQWRNGFEQGKRDAKLARDHANAIGFPQKRPIYMAVDQDVVTDDEFRAMGRYLDGAAEVLGREWVGVYGEGAVCIKAASWGFKWRWQCRAWSGSINPNTGLPYTLDEGRKLYQYYGHPNGGPNPVIGGVASDVNEVLDADWGQHNKEGDMTLEEFLNAKIPQEFSKEIGEKLGIEPDEDGRYLKDVTFGVLFAWSDNRHESLKAEVEQTKQELAEVKEKLANPTPAPVAMTEADRVDIASKVVGSMAGVVKNTMQTMQVNTPASTSTFSPKLPSGQ